MKNLNKYLLFINLFFLQSYLIRFDIGPYPSNLQEILIGLNALTFLPQLKKDFWKRQRILIIFWILTITGILTNEIISQIDLLRHLKFLFFASTLTIIFTETFQQSKEKLQAFKIAGYGAIAFGLFSLAYNLLSHNVAPDLRLLGPLDSAVYLAYHLTPFLIFFAIRKNLLASIILGALIIATKSMGAIAASFIIISWHYRQIFLQSFIRKSILIALSIFVTSAIFFIKIIPTIYIPNSSLDERGQIWKVSAELLKDPQNLIFGTGASQWEANYIQKADQVLGTTPLDYKVIQPHNIFLLFWFHYGILGLIFLSYLILQIAKSPHSVWKLILFYFFIHGLIDTPFYKNDLLIILLILLNLPPNPSKPHKDPPPLSHPKPAKHR